MKTKGLDYKRLFIFCGLFLITLTCGKCWGSTRPFLDVNNNINIFISLITFIFLILFVALENWEKTR